MNCPIPLRLLLALPLLLVPLSCGDKPKAGAKTKEEDLPPALKAANRLSLARSPFLRRHGADPVDWHEWGPEAFKQAKAENKMVMVCVGYSSCPWTLRMQRESYSTQEIANMINRHFIPILVDREDQPDVNNTFLRYTFLATGRSGWPLHIWLTPDGLPVHTAIYLPRKRSDNSASLEATLDHVTDNWLSDSAYINREAVRRFDYYKEKVKKLSEGDGRSVLNRDTLDMAYDKLAAVFDPRNGSFSGAPKFHQAPALDYLLEYASLKKADGFGRSDRALKMVELTVDRFHRGALQDHLSGGFHRYCIDAEWSVPQFEKMLYDQAILASLLLKLGSVTGKESYSQSARQALVYMMEELSHPEGGFYASEHSYSPQQAGGTNLEDGVEGGYYLWKKAEVDQLLGGKMAALVDAYYGLDDSGNLPIESLQLQQTRFRGLNILREVRPIEDAAASVGMPVEEARNLLAQARTKMLETRRLRPRPPRDEKILPGWNGLAVSAFALGGAMLHDPVLVQRAEKAAGFLVKFFTDPTSNRPRYAEDYALLIQGWLDLYEVTGDARWLSAAVAQQKRMDAELWDNAGGGYWDGPEDPNLFMRMKSSDEAGEFAPNAVAALNLVRLARTLGDEDYTQRCLKLFNAFAGETAALPQGERTPSGPATHVRLLGAYDHFSRTGWQFVLAGDPAAPGWKELQQTVAAHFRPNSVAFYLDGKDSGALLVNAQPGLAKLMPQDGRPILHCCKQFASEKSFTDPAELRKFLDETY